MKLILIGLLTAPARVMQRVKHGRAICFANANEIQSSCSLTISKGGMNAGLSENVNADLAGTEMIGSVQTLSTAAAPVNIAGLDQIQVIAIKNMPLLADGVTPNTANVVVGLDTPITQIISTIPPGRAIKLWNPPTVLYAKSSAGTPDIGVAACET